MMEQIKPNTWSFIQDPVVDSSCAFKGYYVVTPDVVPVMMEDEHYPGWFTDNGKVICKLSGGDAEKDARLIASAPSLLFTLDSVGAILDLLTSKGITPQGRRQLLQTARDMIQNATALARG